MRKNQVTFGFESEWQTNAARLNDRLYARGQTLTEVLHPWHCGCEGCDPFQSANFYGQTDSSCSGEIISRVCAFEDTNYDGQFVERVGSMFDILSEEAYAVDAEPGDRSGFHVHVGVGDLTLDERAQNLAAFVRWESVLLGVSAGAFEDNRGYNTTLTGGSVGDTAADILSAAGLTAWSRGEVIETLLTKATSPVRDRLLEEAITVHQYADRHSNLNIRTGHGTWEYRLWNSTRAAWRMELFVRLSIALTDPTVTRWMVRADKGVPALRPQRARRRVGEHATDWSLPAMDRLACHLHDRGHEEAAVLLDRQRSYRESRGWETRERLLGLVV